MISNDQIIILLILIEPPNDSDETETSHNSDASVTSPAPTKICTFCLSDSKKLVSNAIEMSHDI